MERNNNEDKARLLLPKSFFNGTILSLYQKIYEFEPRLGEHCQNVAFLSAQICFMLNSKECFTHNVISGALIHDIGKVYIPQTILNKPFPLEEMEFLQIKKHVQIGHELLKSYNVPLEVRDIVYGHHENIYGTGYPRGIKAVPLSAQIVSVANVYDAMTSSRYYRDEKTPDEAINIMYNEKIYSEKLLYCLSKIPSK